jgi:uncharacterized protein YhaN
VFESRKLEEDVDAGEEDVEAVEADVEAGEEEVEVEEVEEVVRTGRLLLEELKLKFKLATKEFISFPLG